MSYLLSILKTVVIRDFFIWWIESSKGQDLFEMYFFILIFISNTINVCTVTFDQLMHPCWIKVYTNIQIYTKFWMALCIFMLKHILINLKKFRINWIHYISYLRQEMLLWVTSDHARGFQDWKCFHKNCLNVIIKIISLEHLPWSWFLKDGLKKKLHCDAHCLLTIKKQKLSTGCAPAVLFLSNHSHFFLLHSTFRGDINQG